MDKSELKEKFRSGMDKVVASSKKAFQKTESAVQKFSEQSVIRIEIKQFESKRKDELKKLGQLALDKFISDDTAVLSASEEAVVAIIEAVKGFEKEIADRKQKLKDAGADPDAEDTENSEQ